MPELMIELGAALMDQNLVGQLGLTAAVSSSKTISIPRQTGKLTASTFALDAPAPISPDATFDSIVVEPVTAGAMAILKRSAFYAAGLGQSGETFIAQQLWKALADEWNNVLVNGATTLVDGISNDTMSFDSGITPVPVGAGYGDQFLALVRAYQEYVVEPNSPYKILWLQKVADQYAASMLGNSESVLFDSVYGLAANAVPTFGLPVTTDTVNTYAGDFSHIVFWLSQEAQIQPNPYATVSGQPGYAEGAMWLRILSDYNMVGRDPSRVQRLEGTQF
jgi:hypothetical protein